MIKNRHYSTIGENNGQAVLTEFKVSIIKFKLLFGYQHKELAKEYNVSVPTISAISCGKHWSYVKPALTIYG